MTSCPQACETTQECVDLTMVFYSIKSEAVDPVFFAVVPDSFMTRDTYRRPEPQPANRDGIDWEEAQDVPLVSPNDRWSF